MPASKSEILLNCAHWNYEHANRAREHGDDKLAERLSEQAEELFHKAMRAANA